MLFYPEEVRRKLTVDANGSVCLRAENADFFGEKLRVLLSD
jgi:hypothetical protein